jgi:hypothetical protein
MSTIQERLDKLKPYIKGMRFVNSSTVVDALLKENWSIPASETIMVKKGKSEENYYMFYSEESDSTFDYILDYVEKVINFNIENEKKLELIKVNIEELKKHFETKSLDVLKTLKFQFDELTPERDKTVYYENSSLNQEKLELEPNEETH